jgi:hypothetical protein
MTETDELVITEENFDEYFHDVRQHEPEQGQIMACYSAVAYFVDGNQKRNMMDLLQYTNKMIPAVQVMKKCFCASELDSYRVPREMAEDLLSGMSRDQVAKKEYKFTVEMFFYTRPEYVPQDDPHWTTISILNLEEHLARRDERIQSKIEWPEELAKQEGEP